MTPLPLPCVSLNHISAHISFVCARAICNAFDVVHIQLGDMSAQLVALYACYLMHICVCPAESSHHTRMVLWQPAAAGTTSEFDY